VLLEREYFRIRSPGPLKGGGYKVRKKTIKTKKEKDWRDPKDPPFMLERGTKHSHSARTRGEKNKTLKRKGENRKRE